MKPIRLGVRTAKSSRVSVTWLLPLICAALSLAFAPLAPLPTPEPEKKPKRVERPCGCKEIEEYAKVVQKKFDAFKRITRKKMRFKTYPDFRAQFEIEMGWNQSWSEGKGGLAATDEEKKTALEKCRQEHCDWICDVSIWGVHEKYHPWFDHNQMPESVVIEWALDKTAGGHEHGMARYIQSELGAHDLEIRFLNENLSKMREKDNVCEGLSGTPSDDDLEKLFKVSRFRMTNFIRSWQR